MITVRRAARRARYAAVAEIVEPVCSAEAETADAAVELVVRGLNEKFPDGWSRAGQHGPNTVPALAEQLRRILARPRREET